jgi:hypothetical protein
LHSDFESTSHIVDRPIAMGYEHDTRSSDDDDDDDA